MKCSYIDFKKNYRLTLIRLLNVLPFLNIALINLSQAETNIKTNIRTPAAYSQCRDLFTNDNLLNKTAKNLNLTTLVAAPKNNTDPASKNIRRVIPKNEHFRFIQKIAKDLNIKVWLSGESAYTFLHYVYLDQKNSGKNSTVLPFDYKSMNIFKNDKQINLVSNGTVEQNKLIYNQIVHKFPEFSDKNNKLEVTLRKLEQDNNSSRLIELTSSHDPVVLDKSKQSTAELISDINSYQLTYVKKRNSNKENIVEILSFLNQVFKHSLKINPKSVSLLENDIKRINTDSLKDPDSLKHIYDLILKTIKESDNLEYTFNTLNKLNLPEKIKQLGFSAKDKDNIVYWLNKEPLRSFPIKDKMENQEYPKYKTGELVNFNFKATGKTAKDLGLSQVTHTTRNLEAKESITRSLDGKPNVFISRNNAYGEVAARGDGFYAKIGSYGAWSSGYNISFLVTPQAREGIDFFIYQQEVIILNKNILTVIPDNVNTIEINSKAATAKTNENSNVIGLDFLYSKYLNPKSLDKTLDAYLFSSKTAQRSFAHKLLIALLTNPKYINHISPQKANEYALKYKKQLMEILSSSDISSYAHNASNSLAIAVNAKQHDLIHFLLQVPNVNVNTLDKNGYTVLHSAVISNDYNLAKIILENNDVNPNIKDRYKYTALHTAVKNKNIEMVKLLIKNPKTSLTEKIDTGATPLTLAILNDSVEIFEILLQHPQLKGESETYIATAENLAKSRGSKRILEFLNRNSK